MSAADKLPIRFETVEEYDYFCSYNEITREDSKLECLLTYATEAVYIEVVKRNKRDYVKRWRDDYVKAIEEEKIRKKQAAKNRRRDAKREAKQLAVQLNQFMQQMKREMEEKVGMTEERGKNKRKQRIIGHIDEFLSRNEDPEMLREVSDPALTMWSEPKHPMFTNMARKLEDLGPVQPVEMISSESSMLHDGNIKHTRLAAKGKVDLNCQKPPPGSVAAMHTQCQQDSAASATVQLHPDIAAAAQSQQGGTAAVLLLPGTQTAVGPRTGSAARSQQQDLPGGSAPAKAVATTITAVVQTGGATDPVSTAKPQRVKCANTKELAPSTAVQKFTAALLYSLFGCFTCEPEPVLFEDDSSEEDIGRSSMSFATNQKLMEFITANHQLEYDRLRKRIAHARANSLSKYQPS